MHDSLDARHVGTTPSPDLRVPVPQAPSPQEPVPADREVPLGARALSSAVHAWLDGEGSVESLAGAEREVALWNLINAETGYRRRMVTPAHIPMRILAKLADD
jgi:hypothetical protein